MSYNTKEKNMITSKNKLLLSQAVGQRINELIKDNNTSISELSERSHLPLKTLERLASGKALRITNNEIYFICRGLNITLYLFFDSPLFDF